MIDLSYFFGHFLHLGVGEGTRHILKGKWVEGSCFQGKRGALNGLYMPFGGLIPVDDPMCFISKSVHLFDMSVIDQGFLVVANSRFSPRDIVCVQRPHK